MSLERLRDLLPDAGGRRADLCVAAYCHAFDESPEARPDGGPREDGDR